MVAKARWTGRQFHNQPVESHQHQFLMDLWEEVRTTTDGAVAITVHAQNAGVPGSDPQALDMLVDGDLEFMTLMGGILGRHVPVAEIQGVPFAFRSHAHVHAAHVSALGEYLNEECAAKGIHRFHHGLLENGFRHIAMRDKPIRTADDLVDVNMRVPDGEMFRDLFTTLGARTQTVNINQLYTALAEGQVDGQENPLVVTEVNRLYEVSHYMSLTGHMWSGFNLLASLKFWRALPDDVRSAIDAAVARHVARQREFTDRLNRELVEKLKARGMIINTADADSFRKRLADGFYERWKNRFGAKAWALLEDQVGRLA